MEKEQKKSETVNPPLKDILKFVKIPQKLKDQIESLIKSGKIENPSDQKWLKEALTSDNNTAPFLKWAKSVLKRGGKKYEN